MDPSIAELRLKRMTAWDTDPVLTQQDIDMLLLFARLEDSKGYNWTSALWNPTYALNYAASQAWLWKAGLCADRYTFKGDETELSRDQVHTHCIAMYRLYERRAQNTPRVFRSKGRTIQDTMASTDTPWWYLTDVQP